MSSFSDLVLSHNALLSSIRTASEAVKLIKLRQNSDSRLQELESPNKKEINRRVSNLNNSAKNLGFKDISALLLERYREIQKEKRENPQYLIPRTFQKYEHYLEVREYLEKALRDPKSNINHEINLVVNSIREYRDLTKGNSRSESNRAMLDANFLYDCDQFLALIKQFIVEDSYQKMTHEESSESKIFDFYQILIQQRFFTDYSKFVGVTLEQKEDKYKQNWTKIIINFQPSKEELELAKVIKEIFEIEKNHLFFIR